MTTATATRTMVCVQCGKSFTPGAETFTAGDWICSDGKVHVVERRDYFLDDAPMQSGVTSEGTDGYRKPLPKTGRTIITGIPPSKSVENLLSVGWTPGADEQLYDDGGVAEFINGRFSTSDPEQQYWLELRGDFCTEVEWRYAWASDEERERIRLDDARTRLRSEEEKLGELQREIAELRKAG